MKLGKVKKRQYYIDPIDEWLELIPLNEISQSQKNNVISTQQTILCLNFNEIYIGLDLLKDNTNEKLKGYKYIFEFNKYEGLLINVNSIYSHCKIAYYIFK